MPIGMRDIVLTIRAHDLASREIRNVSNSMRALRQGGMDAAGGLMAISGGLIAVGAGFTAAGAASVAFFGSSIKYGNEFYNQVALATTQTQDLGLSVQQIADVVRSVGRDIPAPFEELNEAMFDIFSSMEVNLPQAERLLREFARAAVAGQTEVREAARATIAIMNAFQIPVEDVNRVLDIQFRTVEKGVVTYEELAGSIGRAIPFAVQAGQSVETLGAMLAFMTRNGLSAEMAATSAARAFQVMAHPKTVSRLEEMGVSVRDAAGEFRPMSEIVTQLGDKLRGLPGPERVAVLKELFKGAGGDVRALRFWSLAIENTDQFLGLLGDISNSAGSMDRAYQIMFEQPQSQLQLLTNNFNDLRIEVRDALVPAFMMLVDAAMRVLQWWQSLGPETQQQVIRWSAFAAIALTVTGVVLTLTGAFLGLASIIMYATGVALLPALGIIGLIPLAFAAVIAVIGLLIANWDALRNAAITVWTAIQSAVSTAWQAIQTAIATAWAFIQPILQGFWDFIQVWLGPAFQMLWGIVEFFWNNFIAVVQLAWSIIQPILQLVWDFINTILIPVFQTLWTIVSTVFNAIATVVQWWWNNVLMPIFNAVNAVVTGAVIPAIQFLWNIFSVAFQAIAAIVRVAWDIISAIFQMFIGVIQAALAPVLRWLGDQFRTVWNGIATVVRWAWENVVKPVWDAIVNFVRANIMPIIERLAQVWRERWEQISGTVKSVWEGIKSAIRSAINAILGWIESFVNSVVDGINVVIRAYNSIPGAPNVGQIQGVTMPGLQHGGLIRRAGMALVGERGPEALFLPAGAAVAPLRGPGAMVVEAGAFQFHVYGDITDETFPRLERRLEEFRQEVVSELRMRGR